MSSSSHPCASIPPPSPPLKSIISHTHHSLFQCKHFFHSGLVYLVLLLDLNPFFSKLLPLSSHSCPLLLPSCFPFLLSFLSIPRFFRCSWRTASPTFTCDMIMNFFPSVSLLPLVHKCHFHSSSPHVSSPFPSIFLSDKESPTLLLTRVYSFFFLTATEFVLLCFSVVVAEEGAFHSIKCKMFFKRDSSWSELGIGMLNLKKLEGKTQVLVRNDTTLGKILLNIYLAESTPITRSGKNNVILMCVPNPPLYSKPSEGDNSKPATYLIRVKTTEDADELFSQLNKSKSSCN